MIKDLSYLIGERFKTTKGGECRVIAVKSYKEVEVVFEDGFSTICRLGNLQKGHVKNPFKNKVYGEGVCDINTKGHSRVYQVWIKMLQRCYDDKTHEKQPTYKGCLVSDDWKHFSKFLRDISQMQGYSRLLDGHFQLDKDILSGENKIYSKETCCLVPREINNQFTLSQKTRGKYPIGVSYDKAEGKFRAKGTNRRFSSIEDAFTTYKAFKEARVKSLSDKWKEYLSEDCYKALNSWTINISD